VSSADVGPDPLAHGARDRGTVDDPRPAGRLRHSAAAPPPPCPSARKVDRPSLSDHHDLDLPRVLQLGLDPARDLVGQRTIRTSSTSSGVTTMRTSRPAWMANTFSTPR
jgi:hypothetical protein